jgi:hexosaminidase
MTFITSKLRYLILFAVLFLTACQKPMIEIEQGISDFSALGLIPIPAAIEEDEHGFPMYKDTYIKTSDTSAFMLHMAQFTAEKIFHHSGLALEINPENPRGTAIELEITPTEETEVKTTEHNMDPNTTGESYKISVGKSILKIVSAQPSGLFRGIQTLRQLIPNQAATIKNMPVWEIPGGTIQDAPNYAFRGAMLDVARHFFTIQEVKRYIDLLAYYKINILHLHLTDDQGWRIEIKKWPKLTEVGGEKEVGGGTGGFYTQAQYKDLVAYANKHFITIIPEVDMPGHTNAASVAYPFLNGNGKTPELYTGTEVGFSTWDANNEKVYDFVTDVVNEISAMSPGPYFHLGGDESHVTKKPDYIKFVNRVSEIVKQAGKTPIGWDEIVTADTDSTAIAQFWASEKNAAIAVQKGMKVILSPAKKAYLDMQYKEDSPYGLHWAGYVPVDTAYIWTPETYAKGVPSELILGIEAPLWSETISNSDEIEYLAFPRLPGYAELAWSSPEKRDWNEYKGRLALQSLFFDRNKVNYYPSEKIDWVSPPLAPKTIGKD